MPRTAKPGSSAHSSANLGFEAKLWLAAYNARVALLYPKFTANLHQSRTLATLHETLLPKLLNGELRARIISTNVVATR